MPSFKPSKHHQNKNHHCFTNHDPHPLIYLLAYIQNHKNLCVNDTYKYTSHRILRTTPSSSFPLFKVRRIFCVLSWKNEVIIPFKNHSANEKLYEFASV